MPYIIDARREGGDVIFLGKSITLPSSSDAVDPSHPPLIGSLRFNPLSGINAIEVFHKMSNNVFGWDSLLYLSQATISGATSLNVVGQNGISATGGPITSSGTITLSLLPTGVSAGAYTNASLTVDTDGRVTTIANGATLAPGLTSVSLTSDANFTVTGSPITSSGTLHVALNPTTVTSGTYTNATITVDSNGRITDAHNGAVETVTSVAVTSADLAVTGSPVTGSGTIDLELNPTGITAGTYMVPTLTVDAKGRVTAISSGNLTGFATPEMYGAVGDGLTDDLAAFARMKADASVSMIRLDKTYAVSAAVSFPPGAIVFGGSGSEILPIGTNTVALSQFIPPEFSTRTIFKNVLFGGSVYVNSTAIVGGIVTGEGAGICLEECEVSGAVVLIGANHVVRNCTVVANAAMGVVVPADSGVGSLGGNTYIGGVLASLTSPIKILGCTIIGSHTGATVTQPTGDYPYGIFLDGTVAQKNMTVHVDGNTVEGFQVPIFSNLCNTMVSSNTLANFTGNAIVVRGTSARPLNGVQVNSNKISLTYIDTLTYPTVMLLGSAASDPVGSTTSCYQTIISANTVNNMTVGSGQPTLTMVGYNGVAGILCGFNRFAVNINCTTVAPYGSVSSGTSEVY